MAFYQNNEDEDKDNAQGMNGSDTSQSQSTPVQSSNQSSNIGSGQTGTNSAPKSTAVKPVTSGSGPSFSNYAKQNQGKAQDSLNGAVAQNVANAGQGATKAITQATQNFNTKVDQGSLENRQKAVEDVANTVNSARALSAGNSVDQSQQNRFADVINAQYAGPESLRQSGLYNPTAAKVNVAQNQLDNSKTATGREELLKNMYAQRADYTAGLNKLDSALLNGSQQGVQNLQNVAKAQGNLGQSLDKAQIQSATNAQNRANEILGIKNQARDTFSKGKTAEEDSTENRLKSVLDHWQDLPDYFRNIITNSSKDNVIEAKDEVNTYKNSNNYDALNNNYNQAKLDYNKAQALLSDLQSQSGNDPYNSDILNQLPAAQSALSNAQAKLNSVTSQKTALDNQITNINNKYSPTNTILNPVEAAMLGVSSGEGLYNLGKNAIVSGVADKNKLISKDEQARQAALASLAGLDDSKLLSTNLKYADANKAGTQSALDSLDLEATRKGLNEAEGNFRNLAENTDLEGFGSKKVSRGNAFGKKTKTYSASVGGNVGDFLTNGGYDLNSAIGQGQNLTSQQALLKAALEASTTSRDLDVDKRDAGNLLSGGATGGATGAAIGAQFGGVGAIPGAIIGATLGMGASGGSYLDNLQNTSDIINGYAPGVGKAIQDVRSGLGNAVGSVLGKGIGGAIGGINASDMKAYGSSIAKDLAIKDLQDKYTGFLDTQGFNNRLATGTNNTTVSRLDTLKALLANMDKTNT